MNLAAELDILTFWTVLTLHTTAKCVRKTISKLLNALIEKFYTYMFFLFFLFFSLFPSLLKSTLFILINAVKVIDTGAGA